MTTSFSRWSAPFQPYSTRLDSSGQPRLISWTLKRCTGSCVSSKLPLRFPSSSHSWVELALHAWYASCSSALAVTSLFSRICLSKCTENKQLCSTACSSQVQASQASWLSRWSCPLSDRPTTSTFISSAHSVPVPSSSYSFRLSQLDFSQTGTLSSKKN